MNTSESFYPHIWWGLLFSVSGALIAYVGTPILGGLFALKLSAALTGSTYVCWLTSRLNGKPGAISITLILAVTLFIGMLLNATFLYLASAGLLSLWFVRSFRRYRSFLGYALDFVVLGMSLLASAAAYFYTGSVFLALWCFFLVNGFYVFIPIQALPWQRTETRQQGDLTSQYDEAETSARQALNQLLRQPPTG